MNTSAFLDVKFFEPPAELDGYFRTFYRLEVRLPEEEKVTDILLPEWANLRFFRSNPAEFMLADGSMSCAERFCMTGPTSKPVSFSIGTTRVWGAGLLPLGWASLIDESAHALADQVFDGSKHPASARVAGALGTFDQCEPADDQEFAALTEHFIAAARSPKQEDKIRAAQEAMYDPYLQHIPEFAARAGLSTRSLERLCRKAFGFSPNVLLRRQRLVRSLSAFMNDPEAVWSDTIDRHYHDQPHFVREFHVFMGMSPTQYAEGEHPVLDAFMGHREETWGSPARLRDA